MKNFNLAAGVILLVSVAISSCDTAKKAQSRGDAFATGMDSLREQVYQSVRDLKKSTGIDAKVTDSLKTEYKNVQTSFNTNYDMIVAKIDSSTLNKAECVIFNYKLVLAPYDEDFKASAGLATKFNRHVLTARGAAGIGISDLAALAVEIFKAVAKGRIKVCKDKISAMKFKNWDDI